jgi:Icc-related predicted phosphoesterase
MKVLAFTDIHGSLSYLEEIESKAKSADVLVCCGDLSVFSTGLGKIMQRLDKLGKPLLLIHGNHETEEEMRAISARLKNTYFAHKKLINIDNHLFIGYGGGGFSRSFQGFDSFERQMKRRMGRKVHKKTIFFTHAPPHSTMLDMINDEHSGNESVTSFIRRFSVDYHFSGHFHENSGVVDRIDKTRLMNPGPKGVLIDLDEA